MDIKIILLIIVLICCLHKTKEGLETVMVKDHFKNLMNYFETIFPKYNRNAGGVQFYHYIYHYSQVIAVLEVKKTLNKQQISNSHKNLESIIKVSRGIDLQFW